MVIHAARRAARGAAAAVGGRVDGIGRVARGVEETLPAGLQRAAAGPPALAKTRFVSAAEARKVREGTRARRERRSDEALAKQLSDALRRAALPPGAKNVGRRAAQDLDDAARARLALVANFLKSHRKSGADVGWRTYEVALHECAVAKKLDMIDALLEQAASDGVAHTSHMHVARLRCLLHLGRPDEALATYRTLMAEAAEAAKGDVAAAVGALCLPLHQVAIKAYAARGEEHAAVLLFAQVHQAYPGRLTGHAYGDLLSAAATYETAYNVFELAVANGVAVEVRLLNTVLKFFARLDDAEAADIMLRDMVRAGPPFAPTTGSYSTVILAFKNSADPLRCVDVKSLMDREGVAADAFVYATLLSVLYHNLSRLDVDAVLGRAENLFAEFLAAPRRVVDNVRVWGKMAELLGAAKREDALQEHVRRWMHAGPALTKGSLAVIHSAYRLCGSDKVLQIELLQRERDAYFRRKAEDGRAGVLASRTPTVEVQGIAAAANALGVAGGDDTHAPREGAAPSTAGDAEVAIPRERREGKWVPTRGAFEGHRPVAVVFGMPASVTEAELLTFLTNGAGGSPPEHIVVVHARPDSIARVYARYPTATARNHLLSLHQTHAFGRRLLVLPASDIDHEPTPAQRARLSLDPRSRGGATIRARTTLAESVFKPQVGKKVRNESYSKIRRGLNR